MKEKWIKNARNMSVFIKSSTVCVEILLHSEIKLAYYIVWCLSIIGEIFV